MPYFRRIAVSIFALVLASITFAPVTANAAIAVQRVCKVPTVPHIMECMALRDVRPPTGLLAPNRRVSPATAGGYSPTDLRSAYRVPLGASGVTVAITDAFDDPKAEADLAVYRRNFNLPACTTANGCFRKINQNGAKAPLPMPNARWAGEISVDVDTVSAICPLCHILLVESFSDFDNDLLTGLNTSIKLGARFVSNSWGGPETAYQTTLDAQLNRPGVAMVFSSGDNGAGLLYPASSHFVTAAGGTSLKRSLNARGWSETAWKGTGSGCSRYDARAPWQNVSTRCATRAISDISALADPSTGLAVYQTYGFTGWAIYGGTSVAAPIITAMYAVAGRPRAKEYAASYPYANPTHFHDIRFGNNGTCATRMCDAIAGWDGPTGLGTPDGVTGLRTKGTYGMSAAS
jgi:subtilase family serine protease